MRFFDQTLLKKRNYYHIAIRTINSPINEVICRETFPVKLTNQFSKTPLSGTRADTEPGQILLFFSFKIGENRA